MLRQTAIVGIGQTEFSRDSGRTELQLALEAILAALRDAGIEPGAIDGIVRYSYDNVSQAALVRSLGIRDLRWYGDVPLGGIAQCGVVAQAAAAITAGVAETVIVYRSLNERSGVRYGRAERNIGSQGEYVYSETDRTPSGQFSGPYGLLAPGQVHALWAQRYAYEAGISTDVLSESLGRVAVDQRGYARNNPLALLRERPLDMESYRSARILSTPLRLYDYCLETDGAAAMVLTGAKRARALRNDPVYVLAAHQCLYAHQEPLNVYAPFRFAAAGNIEKLYRDAGCRPEQVDFAELYDATTYGVINGLEIYGFARRCEAWRDVQERGIGLGSPMPTNTHGGHLSEGYIHGMNHLTEAVRQLRGTAANQVKGATIGLVGCAGSSSALLGC